jgi:hypothetical protein
VDLILPGGDMNMTSMRPENIDKDVIADFSWKMEKRHLDELA